MNCKKIGLFLCFLVLGSCSYFNQPSTKILLKKDTIIDFHTIDTYPIFPKCTELLSKEEQKQCFHTEITEKIRFLLQKSFKVKRTVNDTIFIQLTINNKGIIQLKNTQKNNYIPQFDSIIKLQLKQLKNIQPATKRGIPVTTEFILPIILNTEK